MFDNGFNIMTLHLSRVRNVLREVSKVLNYCNPEIGFKSLTGESFKQILVATFAWNDSLGFA